MRGLVRSLLAVLAAAMLSGASAATELEDIHILRSIREPHQPVDGWCAQAKTGFAPFEKDAERFYSFWSVRVQPDDGKILEAKDRRIAELRGCFGATSEPARQNFYAEIKLGALAFQGKGECLAIRIDFPQAGLFPVRCQLVLDGLPAPYVGGLLTTNTLTSRRSLGGETDPPGYTQASIATIRLWKGR